MQGCTPGRRSSWTWYDWPESELPEEGEIAVRESTGSCWLILSVRPSRKKGGRWQSIRVEALGIGAAKLGEEGTFGIVPMDHASYEAIRIYEQMEREGIDVDTAVAAAAGD